jgi:hypothetical protein
MLIIEEEEENRIEITEISFTYYFPTLNKGSQLYSMVSTRVCFVMLFSGLEMLSKRWGTASRLAQVTPQLSSPLKPPARRPKVCLAGGKSRDAELFREQSGFAARSGDCRRAGQGASALASNW